MAPGDGEHGVPVGDVLQAGRRNASESDAKSVAPPVTVCQIDDGVSDQGVISTDADCATWPFRDMVIS